jgi:DNA polymerase
MREVHKRLPKWNYKGAELALWHRDQQINDRGVCMDVQLALEAVDLEQKRLAKRTQVMTDGEVQAATQRDALIKHIVESYGVELPDMQRSTLERRMADPDLPSAVKELLAIRLQASTTSTSKYKSLMKGVSSDGRLRGTLQFCGASRTGRWAGRLFQPQNLPRPSLEQDQIDEGIEALKAGCADLLFDNIMELTSSALRGCIMAPEGKKLVVSDLSNIEGRKLAWLAGAVEAGRVPGVRRGNRAGSV